MVVAVTKDHVLRVWKKIEPHIERALERGLGEWEAGDILGFLLSRDMQLWVTDDLEAACVTQILTYPRKKICDVILVGGSGLSDWKDTTVIEHWAKEMGCDLMRCFGRRGWARAVGWTERQSIATKEL